MRALLWPLALSLLAACDIKNDYNFPNTTGVLSEPEPEDTGPNDSEIDDDGDGYTVDVDCDDADPDVHPDADEVCDGADNDCDEEVDEDATDASAWYTDADEDSYGSAEEEATYACDAPDGAVANADDCDDYDGSVNPDAQEVCDGLDNDCDTLTDSQDPSVDLKTTTAWHADADSDGYGNVHAVVESCDQPKGYVLDSTDCDDKVESTNPGAAEICDGTDNDCDLNVDEEAVDAATWYADGDGDSYGDPDDGTTLCMMPSGYTDNADDCDDTDAAVSPVGSEICDGIDNDCDTLIDDDDSSVDTAVGGATFYIDSDGDGYGVLSTTTVSCDQPSGYTGTSGDCNDSDGSINPAAEEVCDDVDNDCDTKVDDADDSVNTAAGATYYADGDGDGYGDPASTAGACDEPSGYVSNDTDCDDTDGDINPAAAEVCDGADNDCDEDVDDYDTDITDTETYYRDFDGDGYGAEAYSVDACDAPSSYVTDATDCDDTDGDVNPAAAEVCDGADNDCDEDIDDDDSSIDATTQTTFYADDDNDSYGDADDSQVSCDQPSGYTDAAGDCDDSDGSVNPDAEEVCDDVDNDCNGLTDDEDSGTDTSVGGQTYYVDLDDDGYGDPASTADACDEPSGYVSDATDCDDTDGNVNPAATETCDGVDNDCNDDIDDGDAGLDTATADTWHADVDGDGYGSTDNTALACEQPSGYVSDDTDCDDTDSDVNPAASEVCDDTDNDCDGDIDDDDSSIDATTQSTFYADLDGDSYGDPGSDVLRCDQPSGYVSDATDCDDTAAGVNTASSEVCDDIDNDCDGDIDDDDSSLDNRTADQFYADDDGDGYGDGDDAVYACDEPSGYVSDATDCDDADDDVNPAAAEVCDNIDNDCDGDADTGATDAETWYGDADGDGYGGTTFVKTICDQPSGYVDNAEDCDDLDASYSPDAAETCDGEDNDCDGIIDDGVKTTWFADDDGDSYGDPGDSVADCDQPSGYVLDDEDCDDADASASPAGTEVCDSADNDCDGTVDNDPTDGDTWYADSDADGYGDVDSTTIACDEPSGYTDDDTDCDDTDADTNPDAEEACDDVDNDCDGTIDNGARGEGASCAAYSCLDIIENYDTSATDGDYYIDPDGDGTATEVYCDMTTDGGGYSFYKVDYGSSVYASTAESYCDALGMQLFVPRTEDHKDASLDVALDSTIGSSATTSYMYILGIYPNSVGSNCSRVRFNSDYCSNWNPDDGGPYFVGSSTGISEPNGDNSTTGSMYYSWSASTYEISWYNDIRSNGYSSRYFMCQVGDKWGDGVDRGD